MDQDGDQAGQDGPGTGTRGGGGRVPRNSRMRKGVPLATSFNPSQLFPSSDDFPHTGPDFPVKRSYFLFLPSAMFSHDASSLSMLSSADPGNVFMVFSLMNFWVDALQFPLGKEIVLEDEPDKFILNQLNSPRMEISGRRVPGVQKLQRVIRTLKYLDEGTQDFKPKYELQLKFMLRSAPEEHSSLSETFSIKENVVGVLLEIHTQDQDYDFADALVQLAEENASKMVDMSSSVSFNQLSDSAHSGSMNAGTTNLTMRVNRSSTTVDWAKHHTSTIGDLEKLRDAVRGYLRYLKTLARKEVRNGIMVAPTVPDPPLENPLLPFSNRDRLCSMLRSLGVCEAQLAMLDDPDPLQIPEEARVLWSGCMQRISLPYLHRLPYMVFPHRIVAKISDSAGGKGLPATYGTLLRFQEKITQGAYINAINPSQVLSDASLAELKISSEEVPMLNPWELLGHVYADDLRDMKAKRIRMYDTARLVEGAAEEGDEETKEQLERIHARVRDEFFEARRSLWRIVSSAYTESINSPRTAKSIASCYAFLTSEANCSRIYGLDTVFSNLDGSFGQLVANIFVDMLHTNITATHGYIVKLYLETPSMLLRARSLDTGIPAPHISAEGAPGIGKSVANARLMAMTPTDVVVQVLDKSAASYSVAGPSGDFSVTSMDEAPDIFKPMDPHSKNRNIDTKSYQIALSALTSGQVNTEITHSADKGAPSQGIRRNAFMRNTVRVCSNTSVKKKEAEDQAMMNRLDHINCGVYSLAEAYSGVSKSMSSMGGGDPRSKSSENTAMFKCRARYALVAVAISACAPAEILPIPETNILRIISARINSGGEYEQSQRQIDRQSGTYIVCLYHSAVWLTFFSPLSIYTSPQGLPDGSFTTKKEPFRIDHLPDILPFLCPNVEIALYSMTQAYMRTAGFFHFILQYIAKRLGNLDVDTMRSYVRRHDALLCCVSPGHRPCPSEDDIWGERVARGFYYGDERDQASLAPEECPEVSANLASVKASNARMATLKHSISSIERKIEEERKRMSSENEGADQSDFIKRIKAHTVRKAALLEELADLREADGPLRDMQLDALYSIGVLDRILTLGSITGTDSPYPKRIDRAGEPAFLPTFKVETLANGTREVNPNYLAIALDNKFKLNDLLRTMVADINPNTGAHLGASEIAANISDIRNIKFYLPTLPNIPEQPTSFEQLASIYHPANVSQYCKEKRLLPVFEMEDLKEGSRPTANPNHTTSRIPPAATRKPASASGETANKRARDSEDFRTRGFPTYSAELLVRAEGSGQEDPQDDSLGGGKRSGNGATKSGKPGPHGKTAGATAPPSNAAMVYINVHYLFLTHKSLVELFFKKATGKNTLPRSIMTGIVDFKKGPFYMTADVGPGEGGDAFFNPVYMDEDLRETLLSQGNPSDYEFGPLAQEEIIDMKGVDEETYLCNVFNQQYGIKGDWNHPRNIMKKVKEMNRKLPQVRPRARGARYPDLLVRSKNRSLQTVKNRLNPNFETPAAPVNPKEKGRSAVQD